LSPKPENAQISGGQGFGKADRRCEFWADIYKLKRCHCE